jgi:hypothetical protein
VKFFMSFPPLLMILVAPDHRQIWRRKCQKFLGQIVFAVPLLQGSLRTFTSVSTVAAFRKVIKHVNRSPAAKGWRVCRSIAW